ncbi:MAG: putative quinol monooxygenase [Rubricoccaceae bacterium]|nr:putative quinol monooxygenase [Rubricoccaceae bacterium]
MIVRTVQMTFRPDAVEEFLRLFEKTSPEIRAFSGCRHLELWEDTRFPNILSTYSHWDDEAALERYRKSELFRSTWAETKKLFAAPPVASSQFIKVEVGG